jgi:hypothetical protein
MPIPMATLYRPPWQHQLRKQIDFYSRLPVQEKQALKEIDAPVRVIL